MGTSLEPWHQSTVDISKKGWGRERGRNYHPAGVREERRLGARGGCRERRWGIAWTTGRREWPRRGRRRLSSPARAAVVGHGRKGEDGAEW
jgi:hypothetical protein